MMDHRSTTSHSAYSSFRQGLPESRSQGGQCSGLPPCTLDTGSPGRYDGLSELWDQRSKKQNLFRDGVGAMRKNSSLPTSSSFRQGLPESRSQGGQCSGLPPCSLDTGSPGRYDGLSELWDQRSKKQNLFRDGVGAMRKNSSPPTSSSFRQGLPESRSQGGQCSGLPPCSLDTGSPCRYDGLSENRHERATQYDGVSTKYNPVKSAQPKTTIIHT